MPDTRIVLAGLWVALMLVYLLGDVLRVFAGLVLNALVAWHAWTWAI